MYRSDFDPFNAADAATAAAEDRFTVPRYTPAAMAAKRFVDVCGVLVFFSLFFWLYLAIAIGVRWSSKGAVFYAQNRVGQGGRIFRFYKFRSMVDNSDQVLSAFLDSNPASKEQWDKFQKLTSDPRTTRFGRFIRKSSLDEIPQMWNVMKGDMSLVGPRPCMPDQEKFYGKFWPMYCAFKPGLTGLWQVSGRNWLPYDKRVRMDAKYVKEWSLTGDAKILVKTVKVVLTGDGSQ